MLVKGHHEVVLELVKLIAAIKVSARLATVHGVGTPWRRYTMAYASKNYFAVERSFETFRWSKNRFFHLDFYP